MAAELRMKAVRDFLGGPQTLFARDSAEIHESVMALARRDAPERLDASWKDRPLTTAAPRPGSVRALAFDQVKATLRTGFGPLWRRNETVLLDAHVHPGTTAGKGYVMTNGLRSYHLRFVPRRFRMWGLMLRAGLLAPRYKAMRSAAGEVWAADIATYRSADWWAGTFGQSPTEKPGSSPPASSTDTRTKPRKQTEKA
jgi:hypothetical protein